MRVNKKLRDLLLSQPETLVINERSCYYFGTKYTYTPVTDEEYLQIVKDLREMLGLKKKKTFLSRIFRGRNERQKS